MVDNNISDRLKDLRVEDFIWVIYVGIIYLSWISNNYERRYFLFNDQTSRKKYRKILIIIFSVLVVIYLYFLKDSYEDVTSLRPTDSQKKKQLTTLSFIASLLIAISGFIYLYIAIQDEQIDVEIAFN